MRVSFISARSCFMWLMFAASSSVFASEAQLQQFLETVETLQADFQQTVVDESGRRLESSSGKLYLARPGKFRWDYYDDARLQDAEDGRSTPSIGQQIVADGESIYMYDPDLEQVTRRSLEDAIGQVPSLLLVQPKSDLSQHFIVAEVGKTDGLSWVALKPTAENAGYQQLMLGFDKSTIAAITLLDGLGNETKLTLMGVQRNPNLHPALFEFEVPAGADVMEN